MPRIIEVIVSPAGETTVQSKGYPGAECFRATRFLEDALGVKTSDRLTPSITKDSRSPLTPSSNPVTAEHHLN